MKKIYFVIGSQDLYGDETLAQAEKDGREIAKFLDSKLCVSVEALPIVRNHSETENVCEKANCDKNCIGVIMWMHTFSSAKMWIRALQLLRKPMLHLHTQYNKKLPYDSIDMDFMNLNQSAHGDREFGFICTRICIKREIVVGYYKNDDVVEQIGKFADVARAVDFSHGMRVANGILFCVVLRYVCLGLWFFSVFVRCHTISLLKIPVKCSQRIVSAFHGTFKHG